MGNEGHYEKEVGREVFAAWEKLEAGFGGVYDQNTLFTSIKSSKDTIRTQE